MPAPQIRFTRFSRCINLYIMCVRICMMLRAHSGGNGDEGRPTLSLGTRLMVFSGRNTRNTLSDFIDVRFLPAPLVAALPDPPSELSQKSTPSSLIFVNENYILISSICRINFLISSAILSPITFLIHFIQH